MTPKAIVVHAGLRGTVEIPRHVLQHIARVAPPQSSATVNCTFFSAPTQWLILSEPVTMRLPYGLSKQVGAVGIEPDDPAGFAQAIAGG